MLLIMNAFYLLQAAAGSDYSGGWLSVIILIALVLLIPVGLIVTLIVLVVRNSKNKSSQIKYQAPNESYTPTNVVAPPIKTKVERLKELNSLLQDGLISQSDFEEQKKRILDS